MVKKVCLRSLGHLTKMATTPIYGKKAFENLLLQNHWADALETDADVDAKADRIRANYNIVLPCGRGDIMRSRLPTGL